MVLFLLLTNVMPIPKLFHCYLIYLWSNWSTKNTFPKYSMFSCNKPLPGMFQSLRLVFYVWITEKNLLLFQLRIPYTLWGDIFILTFGRRSIITMGSKSYLHWKQCSSSPPLIDVKIMKDRGQPPWHWKSEGKQQK